MKNIANDQAFPIAESEGYERTYGLSRRQLFAAMAMNGALGGAPGSHLIPETLARDSVAQADALILALSKGQS